MRILGLILTVVLLSSLLASAGVCMNATLNGDYGIQTSGTGLTPTGLPQTILGLLNFTFNGDGTFTAVENIKGSITGLASDITISGTYNVNEDCSGEYSHPGPGGVTLVTKFIIVDNGKKLQVMVASPPPVMVSGTGIRK